MLFGRIRDVVKTRNVGHLHHPSAGRTAADRAAGHGAARRKGARRGAGRRDQRRRSAQPDRRPHARLRLPAEVAGAIARDRISPSRRSAATSFRTSASRRRAAQIVGVAGVAGNGQSELMRALAGLQPSTRRDPAEGPPARRAGSAARGRLHALGPAHRGPRRQPDRARERHLRRARQVRLARRSQPQRRGAAGFDDLPVARGEDRGPRSADPVAVRRQPAEGGDGARAALGARPHRGGRADAGRRRRRALRNLPHPARGLEFRHAGHRQLLRRGGTRGPVRSGRRAVARARRRDAARRRRRRSQDRRRRRARARRMPARAQTAGAAARAPAACGTSCNPTTRRRSRWRSSPACSASMSSVRTPISSRAFNVSNILHAGDRARLHRARPDHRRADGRHRPFGRAARRLPGRRRVVLHQRGQVRAR